MTANKRATIRDVAEVASVSAATVSRWLNGTLKLPEETELRIQTSIDKLGFQRNSMARRLSTGLNEAVGLVTPNIDNPFFSSLASAIEEECISRSFMVTLCSTNNQLDRELYYLERLATSAVDGLIFATNHAVDELLLERLAKVERPFVIVDEDVPGIHADRVFADNLAGAKLATEHLISKGHKNILHVGGPTNLLSSQERLKGWRTALEAHGLNASSEMHLTGDYTLEFGRQVASKILASSSSPTAVFAGSDIVAMGIMDALRGQGISIPDDISIVGFDGMRFGRLMEPKLTSVVQPIDEIGRYAAKTLLSRICGNIGEDPVKKVFPVELQMGGTVRQIN